MPSHRHRCLLALLAGVVSALGQGTKADYQRSNSLRDRVAELDLHLAEGATVINKSNRFWYRRTVPGGTEFLTLDSTTGAKAPAFDAPRLAAALAKETGKEMKPLKLPFQVIYFTEDGTAVEFVAPTLNEDTRWRVNLTTYAVEKRPLQPGDPRPLRELPGPRVESIDRPLASPDGKWEALIRNCNVAMREKGKSEVVALTFDGSEGNAYVLGSTAWSPDGKHLAAYRVRLGIHRKIGYIESSPLDQVQPKWSMMQYAKPGDTLDIPQPAVIDVAARKATLVDATLFPNPYQVSRIEWRKDSRAFTFEYNQRGHQVYRVIEVDASTGRARVVVDEQMPTFYCYYSKRFRHDVDDGKEVVWMSERDGWNHLYLYDGASGKAKNQITKGNWVVRSVAKVDDAKRQIWFAASGMHAGKDPYFLHWFRINFDGTGLTPLTSNPDVTHALVFTPDMSRFVDTSSSVTQPPVMELRNSADLSLIATVEKGDAGPLSKLDWRAPEVITAKARDGVTDIWGVLYRPSNFDPAKRYPVLEYIYAGPHDSFVPKNFSAAHAMQVMAELGFIVVQMDGMGTSNRSKAFHDVCWKNIGDAGFPDRIQWHKAVAAKYPWYDTARLGIFGHSAGGQNALGALLFHGDFYKAAVSSAGCHDNRMDKISWNEQWMGWPVGPEYAASSNVEHAANLKGKLMLAVGELDTNVDPASTMQVVNALIKANKTFDFLFLPGKNHGGWGDYWERKREDFFVRELIGVQPPDWNAEQH